MTNVEQARQAVEDAKVLLEKATQQLREAEKVPQESHEFSIIRGVLNEFDWYRPGKITEKYGEIEIEFEPTTSKLIHLNGVTDELLKHGYYVKHIEFGCIPNRLSCIQLGRVKQ